MPSCFMDLIQISQNYYNLTKKKLKQQKKNLKLNLVYQYRYFNNLVRYGRRSSLSSNQIGSYLKKEFKKKNLEK